MSASATSTVVVPDDVHVQIDARIGLGEIDAFGSTRSGYRRSLSMDYNTDRARMIKLKLRVGVGSIEVRRGFFVIDPRPVTVPNLPPDIPSLQYFGDGTVLFEDGSIDFGDGRRIEANGSYQIPIVEQRLDGSVQLDNGAVIRRRRRGGVSWRFRHPSTRRGRPNNVACDLGGAAVKTHRFDPVSLLLGIIVVVIGVAATNARLGNLVNDRPDGLIPLLCSASAVLAVAVATRRPQSTSRC